MQPKYKDNTQPIEERIADLLGRMTLEEKIGQINQALGWKFYTRANGKFEITEDGKKQLSGNGLGSLIGVLRADPWTQVTLETGLDTLEGAEATNAIQRCAIENTRLGIPDFVQ